MTVAPALRPPAFDQSAIPARPGAVERGGPARPAAAARRAAAPGGRWRTGTGTGSATGHTRGAHLTFFGLGITVVGSDLPDFRFLFGPHLTQPGRADLLVEVTEPASQLPAGRPGAPVARELQVRRADGLPLLRRPLQGWTNVPPPFPPFGAMGGRFAITPAAVLARGGTTVALIGHPLTERSPIAVALALRSWRFVAPQLLVLDRRTGRALPFATPVELPDDGRSTQEPAIGGSSVRRRTSPVTGSVLLIRPETIGDVVPVDASVEPPTVVRLCRGGYRELRLTDRDDPAPPWSPGPEPARLRTLRLELPASALADEAASHLDARLAQRPGQEVPCRDARRTAPVFRAGSIA